jgi:hypothetical protein
MKNQQIKNIIKAGVAGMFLLLCIFSTNGNAATPTMLSTKENAAISATNHGGHNTLDEIQILTVVAPSAVYRGQPFIIRCLTNYPTNNTTYQLNVIFYHDIPWPEIHWMERGFIPEPWYYYNAVIRTPGTNYFRIHGVELDSAHHILTTIDTAWNRINVYEKAIS